MQIHQLNLKYDPEQDRLLLRINTKTAEEIRLWLSRRLTVGVLPLMRKLTTEQTTKSAALAAEQGTGFSARDPKVREILSEFNKDATLRSSDFVTPFKEAPSSEGTAVQALLVSTVAITPLANLHLVVKFTGHLVARAGQANEKRDVQIDLDERLMHGFMHLLETAFIASQWSVCAVTPLDAETASGKDATARPQYLN
jgi:hypothetical protein